MSILASFWKPEACGQTVLPDWSVLIGQKLVENAKIKEIKCDILSNFQTTWSLYFWHSLLQRFDIEVKLIWLLKLSLTVRVMRFVLGSLWTNSSESLMMMTLTYAYTPCVVQDDADDSTTFSNTLFPSQIMSNELSNFQDFTTSGHLLLLLLKLLLLLQSRWFT